MNLINCKWCGKKIYWLAKQPIETNDEPHICKPKIKRYTKEEIAKMNKERGYTKGAK